MRGRLVAAIDQGTTSTRCMIFDRSGRVIASALKEHRQIYPQPGWVEHDPLEVLERTRGVVDGVRRPTTMTARASGPVAPAALTERAGPIRPWPG